MNRNRFIDRIEGEEGDQEALALATVLAATCSADFLRHLLTHKLALDEFGGQIFISAARHKVNRYGEPVEHSEPGAHETFGYVLSYMHRSQLKNAVQEPDEVVSQAVVPEPAPGSEVDDFSEADQSVEGEPVAE